jgi:cytochrome P450
MYDVLSQARQTTPVFFSEALQAWCVTTYDDTRAIAANHAAFSSKGIFPKPTGLHPDAQRPIDYFYGHVSLSRMDPPDHDSARRVVHEGFRPRAVVLFEPVVRETIARFVEQLPEVGRFDLMESFSNPITLAVAMKVVGYDDGDFENLREWAARTVSLIFDRTLDYERQGEYGRSFSAWYDRIFQLIDDRMADPRNDLISFMVHNTVRGTKLARDDVANVAMSMIGAGWHTTGGSLTNTIHALLDKPERWAALVKGDVSPAAVAAEGLRYDVSVIGFFRTALEDTEIGGVAIRRGERVFLSYAAANHDPAKFPEPDTFDPGRGGSAPPLNFGHGVHNCVGAPLAKMEMEISLELLARRYPSLRLDGPPTYESFNQFKTPESMWVAAS